MLTYQYTARNAKTGEQIRSEIEASSERDAAKQIRTLGLAPTSISAKNTDSGVLSKFKNRVSVKDKVLFSRQLSTLINAGLPLVQSLRNVLNQTQNKTLQAAIGNIITSLEGGSSFSAALAKHPRIFNRVYISLVAAGETSGTLDKSLERLANQQEKDAEILSKVRSAMIYPAIVLLVMVAVVGFMVIKVLPQVEVLYKGLPGTNLPLVTKILLAVSHFVTKFWYIFVAIVAIGLVFTTRWARTVGGRNVIDKMKIRMWPVGRLFMKVYMARFARIGETLVASGVPLIQMLEVTGDAINNVHVENSLKAAVEKVKGGKALSESLEGDPNFLPLVPNMLQIGEQSGALETMLGKVADYYEKEVDTEIKNIQTIIEPVMMIILGVMAFTVVAAVLLPIYGLAGKSIIH